MEKASQAGYRSQSDSHDLLKDFADHLDKDYNAKGGCGVIKGIPGLVKDDAVAVYKQGRVVGEGHHR